MNILLIGGHGFLGTHLAAALSNDNDVYITSRERSRCIIRTADGDYPLEMSTGGALRSSAFLGKMDAVVPLAAMLGHAECMKDPVGSLTASPLIVLYLLLALRELDRKPLVVYVSSHTAHKPLTSPYAAHKILAEMYLEMFSRVYGLQAIVFRLGTMYGPGQVRPSIVNFYTKRGLEGKTLPIYRGREHDRLALCYVEDAARVFSDAIRHKCPVNVWPPHDVVSSCCTLLEIAETVSRIVGGQVELGVECGSAAELVNPGDSPVMPTFGGWNPTSLDTGVRKTRDWMKDSGRV